METSKLKSLTVKALSEMADKLKFNPRADLEAQNV